MVYNMTILSIKVTINPMSKNTFADWQARLNSAIADFPGFISLEILSPNGSSIPEWVINQRFEKPKDTSAWRQNKSYIELLQELKSFAAEGKYEEQEVAPKDFLEGGITEVFITEVSPDKKQAYREWIAKMHQVEAKFPGFRGVYVQAPGSDGGKNWMTFLQFDTQKNLDHWLDSPERERVLSESKSLIASIESHRVLSSYAGWFSSIANQGKLPPVWKQTMLVLLVLYPIVMFELKYLSPLLSSLQLPISTFIGNAISVALISWPMMPLAIVCLGWWLAPKTNNRTKTIIGTCAVVILYVIEVVLFLKFY